MSIYYIICIIFGQFQMDLFILLMGFVSLLCMSGNFCLDARHCERYFLCDRCFCVPKSLIELCLQSSYITWKLFNPFRFYF